MHAANTIQQAAHEAAMDDGLLRSAVKHEYNPNSAGPGGPELMARQGDGGQGHCEIPGRGGGGVGGYMPTAKRKWNGLRRGKWTPEEEAYANRLIQEFKAGLLPLTDGTTLRTFLSKLMNCDPMRISKKFVGGNCIGKQVFRRRQVDLERLTQADIERSRRELADLEQKFLQRVAHSNRKPHPARPPHLAPSVQSGGPPDPYGYGPPGGFGGPAPAPPGIGGGMYQHPVQQHPGQQGQPHLQMPSWVVSGAGPGGAPGGVPPLGPGRSPGAGPGMPPPPGTLSYPHATAPAPAPAPAPGHGFPPPMAGTPGGEGAAAMAAGQASAFYHSQGGSVPGRRGAPTSGGSGRGLKQEAPGLPRTPSLDALHALQMVGDGLGQGAGSVSGMFSTFPSSSDLSSQGTNAPASQVQRAPGGAAALTATSNALAGAEDGVAATGPGRPLTKGSSASTSWIANTSFGDLANLGSPEEWENRLKMIPSGSAEELTKILKKVPSLNNLKDFSSLKRIESIPGFPSFKGLGMGDRNTSVDDFFSLVTEGTIPAPQPEVLGMPLIDQVVGGSRAKQQQAAAGAGAAAEHPSHGNETKAAPSPGDLAQPENGQNTEQGSLLGKEGDHRDSGPPNKKVKTEEDGAASSPQPHAFETQQVAKEEC